MAFRFPFSTLHELNLDWILEKVKYLTENNEEFNTKADYAVETADEAKTIAEQAAQATIADGAVTTPKLADGAVTGNKIAQATIQTGNLSAGCVTTPKILDGAVTEVKISDGAVSLAKIASALHTFLTNDASSFNATLSGVTQAIGIIRRGNAVYCNQPINNSNGFTDFTAGVTIGSLPTGYRPNTQQRISIIGRTALTWGTATYIPMILTVETNGDVKLYGNETQIRSAQSIIVAGCWML